MSARGGLQESATRTPAMREKSTEKRRPPETPLSGASARPLPRAGQAGKVGKARKPNETRTFKKAKGQAEGSVIVKIRPVGERSRRVTALTDIDVALDALERTTREYQTSIASKAVRRLAVDLFRECESSAMESIELVEEQRVLQQALRKTQSQKRKLRKELLEAERRHAELSAELREATTETKRLNVVQVDQGDAHAFLCGLEALAASGSSKKAATNVGSAEDDAMGERTANRLVRLVGVLNACGNAGYSMDCVARQIQALAE